MMSARRRRRETGTWKKGWAAKSPQAVQGQRPGQRFRAVAERNMRVNLNMPGLLA